MVKEHLARAWYVLHTRSRFENVVNDGLLKKSMEVFLPKIKVPSKRRDRRLMIHVPLFPGYIFVKTDLEPREQLEIVKTIGVVRFIGNSQGPVSVPDNNIESLMIMVSSNNPIATGNRLKRGDRVIVVSGPFTGVTGFFVRYRTQGRVVVNIDALGQYASVDVGEEDVERLPEMSA